MFLISFPGAKIISKSTENQQNSPQIWGHFRKFIGSLLFPLRPYINFL